MRRANVSATSVAVSRAMTLATGRTLLIAWSWVTAWAPRPTKPTVMGPDRASRSVAIPDAAPVRTAVSSVASARATRCPVSVSHMDDVAITLGRPRCTGLVG